MPNAGEQLTNEQLLIVLEDRFNNNMHRHPSLDWASILSKLEGNPNKIDVLLKMEGTGGKPDVIGFDEEKDAYIFCDCSPESPSGRRSVCYDQEALESCKKNKPANSAYGMAAEMGIELLDEEQYRALQKLEKF